MTEEAAAKKKKKLPWGAMFWGGLSIAAAVRVLYHPYRAVMRDGFASKCAADTGCEPTMLIDSFSGQSEIYAPVPGRVVAATDASVYVMCSGEPTLLEYVGSPGEMLVQVTVGEKVGAGQQIGLASRVKFGVYEVNRSSGGTARIDRPYEPAAWLATHGCRVSHVHHKIAGQVWCEGGRKLVVPQTVAKCGLRLPPPNGFALLPVSATME